MSSPNDSPAVLVVSYRRADLLEVCLDSVRRFLPDSPVLVWDNFSDRSDAVRQLAARTPDVAWTFSDVNVGFGAAVNGLAAQVADDRPLLMLNPDAELTGDLALTRAALTAGVAVASPMVSEPGHPHPGWDVARREQTALRAVVSHLGYSERLRGRAPSELYATAPHDVEGYLTGCCLLIDHHAWNSLGGFDERFFVYAEEADLQRRARAAGWRLVLVDEAHVLHAAQGTVGDSVVASLRSADLLRNHQAMMLGAGNTGPGARFLAATALLGRLQRSKQGTPSSTTGSDPSLPHVVLTTNELCRGGAERQRVQLAGELVARGYPVTILCLQDLGPLQVEVDPRVRVVLNPWWQPWPTGLDTAERPTVLITGVTNTEAGFALAFTRARRRSRPVWLVASHEPPGVGTGTYSDRLAAAVRKADGLIALSPTHLAQLTATQELAEPTWLAANGVPDRVHPARPAPRSPLRLGMLSRIVEHKNPHKLIEALVPLVDLPWTLDIFGDGPDRERLEARTPPALADKVTWRGWSAGPAHAFPEIDVLCVPSETEAFPLAIVEAMAAGVPVIAAGVCAVPDMLDHGGAGVVVGLGDTAGWTSALRAAVENPEHLLTLAAAARNRQQALYTVATMADAYVIAIGEVVAGAPAVAGARA